MVLDREIDTFKFWAGQGAQVLGFRELVDLVQKLVVLLPIFEWIFDQSIELKILLLAPEILQVKLNFVLLWLWSIFHLFNVLFENKFGIRNPKFVVFVGDIWVTWFSIET